MFAKRPWLKWVVIGAGVLLVACMAIVVAAIVTGQSPTWQATVTAKAQGKTQTAAVTPVPSATPTAPPTNTSKLTPQPSKTPQPTLTPRPTNTEGPTVTPRPTNTPEPSPTPIVFTGSGDAVVDITKANEPMLVHIVGNAGRRFFAVQSYDTTGNQLDLLVNTTDPYDGVRPLDFMANELTTRFQIQAVGKWTIEVLPLTAARVLEVPGTITGIGDDVVILRGGKPDTAKIKGNAGGRFFAVQGYGARRSLLVNTTDPYDGTVILSNDTAIIEVRAIGEWSIEVTVK